MTWLLTLVLGCAASSPPRLATPRKVVAPSPADVATRNLAPAEEIDALLLGDPELGRMVDPVRVAVPAFAVAGGGDELAWLGETAAELAASELATSRGVLGFERAELRPLDEVLDGAAPSDARVVEVARSLGASAVILGTVTAGPQLALAMRAIHVASGKTVHVPVRTIDRARLDLELRDQLAALMRQLGVTLGTTRTAPPLGFDRLALAARARDLQRSGKLVEAQPLYAQALARPSSAWRFEASYLELMNDLGLSEWSAQRAATLLERMRSDETTVCDRARITIQRNRHEPAVQATRDAVRLAASCGEPELVARALHYLAGALERTSYPTAREAMHRALAVVPAGRGAATRCMIDYGLRRFESVYELTTPRDPVATFSEVATACEAAGNLRFATLASARAARWAWDPKREVELRERELAIARRVGGTRLDTALLDSARALRGAGQPIKADDRLLQLIGGRLAAIIALYGALPYEEQKLDDDLLARAGVRRPDGVPAEPTGLAAALARAHRGALAKALRAWAERTGDESSRQADLYRAIANDLDGTVAETRTPAKRLEVVHRLPLDKILASPAAPLHADAGNLLAAFDTLRDWHAASTRDDERDRLLVAIKRVAGWIGNARVMHFAALTEIDAELKRGRVDQALVSIRAAERYSRGNPRERRWLLRRAIEAQTKKRDRAALLEAHARMVELTEQLRASYWVSAVYDEELARLDGDPRAYTAGARRLAKLGEELAAKHAWEPAADALAKAARLFNNGKRADGSPQAVRYYRRRVEWLERTGDPLRVLTARAELVAEIHANLLHTYRSGADRELARSRFATAIVADIAKACEQLVAEGRHRDAVRVVAKLPAVATGVDRLVDRAMKWSASFKSSAEYLPLLARLHWKRAVVATNVREKIAQYAAARDAFAGDKDLNNATWVQRLILQHVSEETELWAAYDACLALAGANDHYRVSCVLGLGSSLIEHGQRVLTHRDKLASVLAFATPLTRTVDAKFVHEYRMRWRYHLAVLAAQIGDRVAFERFLGEVEKYYTVTAPDAYQWATALARVAGAIEGADPKLAIAVKRKFYAANGASSYWIVTAAVEDAAFAAKAGDRKAEAEFLAHGKRAAKLQPRYAYRYARYEAEALYQRGRFKAAARAYLATADVVKQRNPDERRLLAEMHLRAALAMARGNQLGAARDQLRGAVAEARKLDGAARNAMPCFYDQALQVASGVEMAARRCEEGAALRELAERMRARCTAKQCAHDRSQFCDGPGDLELRSTNACGRRFAIEQLAPPAS